VALQHWRAPSAAGGCAAPPRATFAVAALRPLVAHRGVARKKKIQTQENV
jgi:hypothetical protein